MIVLVCNLFYIGRSGEIMAEDWIYTVQPGDNLWNLTEEYLIDMSYWSGLRQLNKIADPYHIPPGSKLRVPVKWITQFSILAKVNSIHGQAELIDAESGKITPLSSGNFVFMGDSIQTKPDSTLVLEFVDGSTLLVQPDSRLVLNNLSLFGKTGMADTQLHLNQGRVETKVEKKKGPASRFEISTPVGVTSVRGTDYRVSSEPDSDKSLAEVLEGGVRVNSASHTKLITEGYGSQFSSHAPPSQPIELLAAIDTKSIPEVFDRVPIQFVQPSAPKIKGYRLQIFTDQNFDEVLFDRKYITNQIRGPELPDGDYYGRIRGMDENGLEGKNAEFQFKINAKPEAPFLQDPKPDAGLIEETPGFIWARQEDIQKYHFQLARDKLFNDLVVDLPNLQDNFLNSGYLLELKQYFWRVASISEIEGQGPYSDTQTFKRLQPPPTAEEPTINDTSMVLRWSADLPDVKYHVQLSKDETFSELTVDKQVPVPSLEIERPESGEYFMRISSEYPDGFVGPFGKPQIIDVPSSYQYWWLLGLLPLLALIAI
jgi:LysM repeat protein